MSHRRGLELSVLALLTALGLLVWWALGDDPTPVPGGAPGAQAAHAPWGGGSAMEGETPDRPRTDPPAADTPEEKTAPTREAIETGTAAVLGRVVGPEGTPVAGAEITLRPRFRMPADIADLADDPTNLAEILKKARPGGKTHETATDADGHFRVVLSPGQTDLRLGVRARGYMRVTRAVKVKDPEQLEGGELPLGEIVLVRGAVLAGVVTDTAGRPVEGARVRRTDRRSGSSGAGGFDVDAFDLFGALEGFEGLETLGMGGGDSSERTDASGRFELAHARPGAWALKVTHTDHPATTHDGGTLEPGEVRDDIRVQVDAGAEIAGRVLALPGDAPKLKVVARAVREERPAANPAEGLMGLLGDGGDFMDALGFQFGERTARVEADGQFRLRGLRAERTYRLWATQSGSGTFQVEPCTERQQVPAGSRGVELHYRAGIAVTFQVLDDRTGQPIPKLDVSGGGAFAGALFDEIGAPKRTQSYPEGRVTLTNLRAKDKQRLKLTVGTLGFSDWQRKDIVLPREGSLDLGTVRLRPTPVVHVVVTDARTGAPVRGARVTLARKKPARAKSRSITFETRQTITTDPTEGMPEGLNLEARTGNNRTGRTDDEGRCSLNSYPGKTAVIQVRNARHASHSSEILTLPEQKDLEHAVALSVGGTVEIFVVDADGEPLGGARIRHRPPGRSERSLRTTESGSVVASKLAPGEHEFALRRKSTSRGRTRIQVSLDEPRRDPSFEVVTVVEGERAELTLKQPVLAILHGVVRQNGEPLRRARVRFVPGTGQSREERAMVAASEQLGGAFGDLLGQRGSSTRTDSEGRYRLEDLPVGQHRLRVTHRDRAMPTEVAVGVAVGETRHDVELTTTVIEGRVIGPDGVPLEDAKVSVAAAGATDAAEAQAIQGFLNAMGSRGSETKTDADGVYRLSGVQPDAELVVRVTARHCAPGTSRPVKVAPGETVPGVDVQLTAAGRIRVRVEGGTSFMAAVTATFEGETEDKVDPVLGFLRNRRATLQGLRPGRWKVELSAPGTDEPQTAVTDVVAGETAEVSFRR